MDTGYFVCFFLSLSFVLWCSANRLKQKENFHFVLKLFKQFNRLSAHLLKHECERFSEKKKQKKKIWSRERASDKCRKKKKKILKEWREFLCTIVVCTDVCVCIVKRWNTSECRWIYWMRIKIEWETANPYNTFK